MSSFKVTDPDHVDFTLVATYSLGTWKSIRDTLNKSPNLHILNLRLVIDHMVDRAEQNFANPMEDE